MSRNRWVAVLLGLVFLSAAVDFACADGLARGRKGYVGTPIPPVVGIIPGTLTPGTCNPCTDSTVAPENYFYGNPWPPQHQPARQGLSSSPYYNSDVMMQWIGAQLDTVATKRQECLIGASPSGAISGSPTDYGIDHVTFAADGSDTTGPSAPITVSTASGDPQNYTIVSITGNGTTAVATMAAKFGFTAPIPSTGEGYGYHVAITGAGSFNGNYQLSQSAPADLTHTNSTVSFPSAFVGTVSGGTMNVTEPMYWCITVDPANFADGLHELRATVYPKVGWPRLMQGPHYIERSGANTSIDEANGTGIFTVPAHGWSYGNLTIDSVGSPGASPCLVPTGGGTAAQAQNYRIAVQTNAGLPGNVRPAVPLRGYQFALYSTLSTVQTYQTMQGCTDDQIIINDFRGTSNIGINQFWMPYGGNGASILLPPLRNNHALWFFTNSHATAYNPTLSIDGAAGSDTAGCGAAGSPCASIDGAINFSPQLNANATGSSSAHNTCTLNASIATPANAAIFNTPAAGTAGSCNFFVGGTVWAVPTTKRGMHIALPYWVVGIANEAVGAVISAGGNFVLSSVPLASFSGAPSCTVAPSPTVLCATSTGTITPVHAGGDGVTLTLAGTAASPQYYNFGSTNQSLLNNANYAQWFTIQGQTHTGAIINSSGHATYLADAVNVLHDLTAASWATGQQETVTYASSVAPIAGTTVQLAGLSCTGCGNPNGSATVVSSTATSAVLTNTGLLTGSSGTMATPVNINQGNAFSWIHLKNLSVCGIDPAVNVTKVCDPNEVNPYSDVQLAPGSVGVAGQKGGLWVDNTSIYGYSRWNSGGCITAGPTPCSTTNNWSAGIWFTNNSDAWNMGTGPVVDYNPGFSTAENMLYSGNLGQFAQVGLIRNVTDDGLAQGSYTALACAAWITAGNLGSVCNTGGANTVTNQNLIPVTGINKDMVSNARGFGDALTPFGGTYVSRFGWADVAAWFVNVSFSPSFSSAGCVGGACTAAFCYDATGVAPNCPGSIAGVPVAAVANCVTAHVSCFVLAAGQTMTATASTAALYWSTGVHVDAYFTKDAAPNAGFGSTTDAVTVNFNIPEHACDTTQTGTTCNASEGMLSQSGIFADWAVLDLNPSQLTSPVFHPSQYFENFYIKNINFAAGAAEQIAGLDTQRQNSFFGGPVMPPGGGFYGNGMTDGMVFDNAVCSPINALNNGVPLYYGYWAQTIQGNGTTALMTLGDAGITIPNGTPIVTQSLAPQDTTQATKNAIINPTYSLTGATTVSGSSATSPFSPSVTFPVGTPVTIAGVSMPYTPISASWSGTAETVTFSPTDTVATAASVTLAGLSCTSCGGTPNPNGAFAVTASSPGSVTFTNASLSGSGTMTLASPTLTQTTKGLNGSFGVTSSSAGSVTYAGAATTTVAGSGGNVTINGYMNNDNSSITWSGTVETIHSLPGITVAVGQSVTTSLTTPANLSATGTVLASPAPSSGVFSINVTGLTGSGTATEPGVNVLNNGAVNGFNTPATTVSGTVAGQVSYPSTVNLPIMLDNPSPGATSPISGFVIVPTGLGSHEDAASYMNPPALNACSN